MNCNVFNLLWQGIKNLLWQGIKGHKGWPQDWHSPEPKSRCDAVIIGSGEHGLASILSVTATERSHAIYFAQWPEGLTLSVGEHA